MVKSDRFVRVSEPLLADLPIRLNWHEDIPGIGTLAQYEATIDFVYVACWE